MPREDQDSNEQGDNASRVVYLGAGLRADIKRSGPTEIAEKVDRLVQDPVFKQCAHAVARELAMTDGARTASRLIARLAMVRLDTPMPWEWHGNQLD